MFGIKTPARGRERDEAEKPFWISFSDLMTALMVLFLVAMASALVIITTPPADTRGDGVKQCRANVLTAMAAPEFKDFKLEGDHVIDFGSRANFREDGNDLKSEQKSLLRRFVTELLKASRSDSCEKWLKRIVVEGFANQNGSYLYNLNLSLERSQGVLCGLLDDGAPDALNQADRKSVRKMFLVGGSSFNSPILDSKVGEEKSRRVEFRLEFRPCDLSDPKCSDAKKADPKWDDDTRCPIRKREGR